MIIHSSELSIRRHGIISSVVIRRLEIVFLVVAYDLVLVILKLSVDHVHAATWLRALSFVHFCATIFL